MAKQHGGGPKTKLTDDLINEITLYVENGLNNKDAANLCNVRDTTVYRWLREADILEDGKPPKKYAKQRELKQALIKAQSAFKAANVRAIYNSARKSWQASAWLLERKFPEEYGATDRAYALNMQRMATMVQEDDGLLDALNSAVTNTELIGDVPSDI